ncbi:MAG: hypothetical protein AAGD43_21090 [Pseudomonadota bacterium]
MHTLRYLDPVSSQTLRQGIEELKRVEGADGDAAQNVSEDLVDRINLHDAIHVLFACPTDLRGEIAAHVWTAVGTTMTIRNMHDVNQHRDHRQVLSEIGYVNLAATWVRAIPTVIAILWRSRSMNKLWPAYDYQYYLDCRLCDLRSVYGVHVLGVKRRQVGRGGAALRWVKSA